MLISYNWLKKNVNLSDSTIPEEVSEKLKASTVEVEKIEVQGKNLENIVVGKILSVEKHPNADKLKLCKVDVGNEQLQIVCGGSNVAEGMLVALAKVGSKVKWHGEGDLIELKPTKIRDVESAGMICASTEIGLGEMFPLKDEKEILDLTYTKAKPGTPMAQALGLDDAILEIDNKSLSNRPDLWGHYGIAREVAVLFNKHLKEHKIEKIKPGKEIKISVDIQDKKLCPRYMAVAMSGIKVGESPQWLKKSLSAVGLRSINNIVDITNFVMLDLGQPMHAFDASKIKNSKIVVRLAKDGEEFITLDEQTRKLDSSMLMICTEEKSLAIAGVMGGMESGINDQTNTIIFESANFEPGSIRTTSTKLGLRTDSSARFEKSLDPNLTILALEKAVELVLECCPGAKVASKVIDESNFALKQGPIEFSLEFLEKKIGVHIPPKEVVRILEQLGFVVKTKGKDLLVKIPSWRATKDISIAEDLVEEVIRIYGYDKIGATMPNFSVTPPEQNKLRALEREIKDILVRTLSYTEVYNYSFVSAPQIEKMGDNLSKYIELDNPLSKEKPYLRRNLLPNLLENINNNIDNYSEVKIFEIGKVFSTKESGLRVDSNGDSLLPRQDTWLATVYAGKKDVVPFWQARHALENVFTKLNLDFQIVSHDKVQPWEHPSRLALVLCGDETIGILCEINPLVSQNLGIEQRVGVLQLNLSLLEDVVAKQVGKVSYKTASIYPEISRDLAIVVKKQVAHQDILSAVLASDPLLKTVSLFDVFEGANIGAENKSMAYRFVYQHNERTLVTEEVEKAHNNIIKILKEKFNAEVR